MLAQIDGQSVKDHVDDLDAQVAQMALDLRRLGAQQQAATESARQRVREAQAALDKAKQEMRALEVKTSIDRQRLQLKLEEAQVTYEQQKQELPLLAERQESERRIAERITKADPATATVIAATSNISHPRAHERARRTPHHQPARPAISGTGRRRVGARAAVPARGRSLAKCRWTPPSTRPRASTCASASRPWCTSTLIRAWWCAARSKRWVRWRRHGRGSKLYPPDSRAHSIDDHDPRVIPDLTASADVVVAEQGKGLILPREAIHEKAENRWST